MSKITKEKNLYIFEKSYFNMINNIEDDDLL